MSILKEQVKKAKGRVEVLGTHVLGSYGKVYSRGVRTRKVKCSKMKVFHLTKEQLAKYREMARKKLEE